MSIIDPEVAESTTIRCIQLLPHCFDLGVFWAGHSQTSSKMATYCVSPMPEFICSTIGHRPEYLSFEAAESPRGHSAIFLNWIPWRPPRARANPFHVSTFASGELSSPVIDTLQPYSKFGLRCIRDARRWAMLFTGSAKPDVSIEVHSEEKRKCRCVYIFGRVRDKSVWWWIRVCY